MVNKVSILSYSTTKNYGGLLQMFALQKILIKQGYYAEHIRYREPKTVKTNSIKSFISKVYSIFLKKIVFDKKRQTNEERFRQELNFSKQLFCDSFELSNYQTDCFIVGSDQVWNPFINGFDDTYALLFNTTAKKIAYSASIGIDKNVPKKWIDALSLSLGDFSYISVREKSAKNILSPFVTNEINIDLDPTLLLNDEEYEQLAKKSALKIKDNFILCYLMPGDTRVTKRILRDAKAIAKQNKLKIVIIGLRDINRFNIFNKSQLFGCGPYEYVYLLKNANVVLTNSFHGTALSVLFNKRLLPYINSKLDSSDYLGTRITNLTNTLGLSHIVVDIANTSSALSANYADYKEANIILEKKRTESLSRLLEGIKI